MERDISEEIELKNGKGNGVGWSQYEVWHEGRRIGWIESGCPMDFVEGYRFEEVPEGKDRRLLVYATK